VARRVVVIEELDVWMASVPAAEALAATEVAAITSEALFSGL
jgi:hypothetical protein